MKILQIKVYEFSELSEDAKEKAREWFREGYSFETWWEGVYEDAANIGIKITSFNLDRNRHAEGIFTENAETVASAIIENHGKDCETYKTAKAFQYAITVHSSNMEEVIEDAEEEFLKSLLEDYSIILQHEYEYLLSNESVDENIQANEYTFTETGKREG